MTNYPSKIINPCWLLHALPAQTTRADRLSARPQTTNPPSLAATPGRQGSDPHVSSVVNNAKWSDETVVAATCCAISPWSYQNPRGFVLSMFVNAGRHLLAGTVAPRPTSKNLQGPEHSLRSAPMTALRTMQASAANAPKSGLASSSKTVFFGRSCKQLYWALLRALRLYFVKS